jgi:hypothetical protein
MKLVYLEMTIDINKSLQEWTKEYERVRKWEKEYIPLDYVDEFIYENILLDINR